MRSITGAILLASALQFINKPTEWISKNTMHQHRYFRYLSQGISSDCIEFLQVSHYGNFDTPNFHTIFVSQWLKTTQASSAVL
jgi:hypothetical protein